MFTLFLFHKPPSDLHLSKYFVWPKRKLAMAKNNFKTYIINNICTYTSTTTTTTQFLNVFFTRKPFDILLNPLSFFLLYLACWWESSFGKAVKGQRGSDLWEWDKGQRAFLASWGIWGAFQRSIGFCQSAAIRFVSGLQRK